MESMMIVNKMLKHVFEPGKILRTFLQERAYPVSLPNSLGTFDLGYKPTIEDKMKAKKKKEMHGHLPRQYHLYKNPSSKPTQ
ncbi:hypothetical protein R3W88_031748 [Solanum pinnatisectum]|uniref:Uncharacterized protein n=1 Tax=Solanum pinnatisectum TaxID=50273 RepID=A0AAV9LM76_9SOLN|nr:hypothetical protein R3W88_031748 [Solanum pinnatisectum]